jgi:hypothetical protein
MACIAALRAPAVAMLSIWLSSAVAARAKTAESFSSATSTGCLALFRGSYKATSWFAC